jgi:hypothetical protein
MVPQFRPQAALHMLTKLITYADLSPLLPSNATLASLTDSKFQSKMDKWTKKAKAAPYLLDDPVTAVPLVVQVVA